MAVVIFMTHACLGWRQLTLAQSLKILKEHQCCVKFHGYLIFLSNRFDVDFFSSLGDLFTMREYQVSEMESTTAEPRSPKSLTRRELSPKQE